MCFIPLELNSVNSCTVRETVDHCPKQLKTVGIEEMSNGKQL